MFTNTIIVLCATYTLVRSEFPPEVRDRYFAMQQECMKETGVTHEMLAEVFQGHFPDYPEFKEQIVCVGKKSGIMDGNGQYHKDVLKKIIVAVLRDEGVVEDILNGCFVEKSTLQETAFETAKCSYLKLRDMIIQ